MAYCRKADNVLEGCYVQSCSASGSNEAAGMVLAVAWPLVGFEGVLDNGCLSLQEYILYCLLC